jgi:hypothetical protein
MPLNKQFVMNLHGKDYVKFEGLLDLGHQDGLSEVTTDIVDLPTDENGNTCIVRARVVTKRGIFTGIGDASPNSVGNKMIAVHLIRMAETRAVARALRFATNIGMTALEELGDTAAPKDLKVMSQKQHQMLKGLASDNALPQKAKDAITEFLSETLETTKMNPISEYLKTSERASALIKRALEIKEGK